MSMNLLQMSFSGAVLIAMIALVRALFINRLPKKTFLILWSIALLRLLVPLSVPSVWSAYSLFGRNMPVPVREADVEAPAVYLLSAAGQTAQNTALLSDMGMLEPRQSGNAARVLPFPTVTDTHAIPVRALIWGIGTLLCGIFFVIAYVRCRLEFRASLPIEAPFVEQWRREHPLNRFIALNGSIAVRQSDRITSPLTYGIFRPVILLPKKTDWEKEQELSYILLHEYVHIRRCDAARKLISTAVLCLHWFNPMVWLLYILFNRDIELVCDECVVRQCGEDAKSPYARTLICLEEQKSGLIPLCNSFSRTAIEERIKAIMKVKKTSPGAIAVAGVLITGVTVAFATSAMGKENPPAVTAETEFSEEELEKLLALQPDGYENMTIAEYQEKMWTLTDTEEYRALLDRLEEDEKFYELRESNELAAYLFYTFEPLTAEKWQVRDFNGSVVSGDSPNADNALLEYVLTMVIMDEDTLTVRAYNEARIGFAKGVEAFLKGATFSALPDEAAMEEAVRAEIKRLTEQLGREDLYLSAEYSFRAPEYLSQSDSPEKLEEEWAEEEKALQEQALAERGAQWAKMLAPYLPFGVTYCYDKVSDDYKIYYQGKEVRGICDERAGIWITEHSGIGTYGEDAVELYAVYDDAGHLTGLREATVEEEQEWMSIRTANSASAASLNETEERRGASYGTEDDYRSLLSLKTADYRELSVADFNRTFLEWCNENYEAIERIGADTGTHTRQISLSESERAFVELTVELSGEENAKYVQSNYTGRPEADPSYAEQLPEKLITDARRSPAWCDLYYRFSYHITDKGAVTVGERDDCIGGMIHAVHAFWEETDINELLAMTEVDVIMRLRAIAAEYGNDRIEIIIDGDGIGFESMDERGLQW